MADAPFHEDELKAQALAGGGAGGGGIHAFMPQQHRDFFAQLSYLFVGVIDAAGWPLATLLTGAPGFVQAPNAVTLRIDFSLDILDPAASAFVDGRDIAILGLDLSTRRRNRANGRIAGRDADGLIVAVRQSFGNCPKYIQLREMRPAKTALSTAETFEHLDLPARDMIARADTLFVASRARSGIIAEYGADISHRGGRPGFVRVENDVLTIPDFRGNRYFNTIGNLIGDPRSALLLVDFETGDLLQLQCVAEVNWEPHSACFPGAERLVRFRVVRGWRRKGALPWRGTIVEYAPSTLRTGLWHDGA